MKNKRLFLLLMFMCVPTLAFADVDTSSISNANDIAGADEAYIEAIQQITNKDPEKISEAETHMKNILDSVLKQTDTRTAEEKNQALSEKQDAYNAAKEKEQSLANRTLTALSTAATGIGGMELAMGLSEQKADKAAEADMTAYLETFRCTYGDGKQVKAGPEEIELPGGNDAEFMNLRAEYMALATDLKERKEALGMKPGLESEAIMDKAQMGLYDSENIGITNGAYASLYRAMALGSESDQAKIDEEKKASKNRVIAGAVVGGVGVVGSMVGNSLINGKLGELIKDKNSGKSLKAAAKIESDALDDIKKCLKNAGVKNTDSLSFSEFYPSVLSIKSINCKTEITKINNKAPSEASVSSIFEDSTNADAVYQQLVDQFGSNVAGKMIGVQLDSQPTEQQKTKAIDTLTKAFERVETRFKNAAKEDNKRQETNGTSTFDFSSLLSNFSGDDASSSIMSLVNGGLK